MISQEINKLNRKIWIIVKFEIVKKQNSSFQLRFSKLTLQWKNEIQKETFKAKNVLLQDYRHTLSLNEQLHKKE